jgi:hypothetical protein
MSTYYFHLTFRIRQFLDAGKLCVSSVEDIIEGVLQIV